MAPDLDFSAIAAKPGDFSGAGVTPLCESAAELGTEESMTASAIRPITDGALQTRDEGRPAEHPAVARVRRGRAVLALVSPELAYVPLLWLAGGACSLRGSATT